MAEKQTQNQAETKESPAPLPPLTVAEIVGYKPPKNLTGFKLTPETNGGYSYRARIDGILYIAIPHEWEGRTMTTNPTTTAQVGENFGLNLNELPKSHADTFTTNSGTFRPVGAENVTLNGNATATAVLPADGSAVPPSMPGPYDNLFLPGAIVVAAAIYFITKRKV
jgi:hypothetical protein